MNNLKNELDEAQEKITVLQEELNRTNSELLQLTLNLDDMVEARTRELSLANSLLAKEILERNKIEVDLRLSEERYKVVVDLAYDAIICIDETDSIYLWNKRAEDIFGFTVKEALGKSLHNLIMPEKYRETAKKGLELFVRTGEGPIICKTIELTARKKDGTVFPVELSVSAMKVCGNWHATGIIRDITKRKMAEATIMEQLDYLERFNKATVNREIRMHEIMLENEKLKLMIAEIKSMRKEKE